jgi:hypothetical protein
MTEPAYVYVVRGKNQRADRIFATFTSKAELRHFLNYRVFSDMVEILQMPDGDPGIHASAVVLNPQTLEPI